MNPGQVHRREFLRAGLATTALGLTFPAWARDTEPHGIITVTGPIRPDELGTTLPHEHVLVDFVGADHLSPDRYDRDEAFQVILPHVKRVRDLGCQSIVECTPAYLGRDPRLLKRLSEASGMRLLTNTGYYGAGQGKFLPKHAFQEDADELAKRWLDEWKNGIDGTGIRPGFIKIGVDAGPLTEVNRKIVQAAARTHLKSGLTIAGHTGDGPAALEQLDVLRKEGVDGSAWIWVHAQNKKDPAIHRQVAERGAWVSLDGVSPTSIEQHLGMVQNLKQAGHLDHVLVSHDAGWFSVGEPRGGKYRGYETLFTEFLPALRKAGFDDDQIQKLAVTNPGKAYSISVRRPWFAYFGSCGMCTRRSECDQRVWLAGQKAEQSLTLIATDNAPEMKDAPGPIAQAEGFHSQLNRLYLGDEPSGVAAQVRGDHLEHGVTEAADVQDVSSLGSLCGCVRL